MSTSPSEPARPATVESSPPSSSSSAAAALTTVQDAPPPPPPPAAVISQPLDDPLSPEEHATLEASLKRIFDALDIHHDGFITNTELRVGLEELGLRANPERVDDIWANIVFNDRDGDGKINYEEFRSFAMWRTENLRRTFNEIDADGNGVITPEELQLALTREGLDAPMQRVRTILRHMDNDHNGKVTFDDFRRMTLLFPSHAVNEIFDDAGDVFVVGYLSIPKSERQGSRHKKPSNPLVVLLSGGMAGLVSRTCTAPADRIKVMMQAGGSSQPNGKAATLGSTIKEIVKEGGVRSFWRGNGANVVKIMPESACKFFMYENMKRLIAADQDDIQVHERLLAGSLAGVAAQTAIYPMEVVKTRLALAPPGFYGGIVGAATTIARKEGVAALYNGLMASNLGIIPYAGVDLAVYGTVKDRWMKQHPDEKPSALVVLGMGSFSSFCGQIIAYPLQLVRTKLQSVGLPGRPVYTGLSDVVRTVMKTEGPLGFYRGIVPNFMKGIPAVAIGYVAYEKSQTLVKQWLR